MGAIRTGPGSPLTFSSASGGKVYAYNNLTTVSQLAAPANPTRQRLTFHNPGSVDVFVHPTVTATGTALVPTTSALGGTFRVFGNGGTLVVEGECQTQWNAFAASGSGNPLTVMDTNV